MNHLAIAALIVLSTGAASAEPFAYQQQVGSSELDPSLWEGPALSAQPLATSDLTTTEFAMYRGVDIYGSAVFAHVGRVVPSVVTATDNYEQVMTEDVIN
jgi:hypothetical protein